MRICPRDARIAPGNHGPVNGSVRSVVRPVVAKGQGARLSIASLARSALATATQTRRVGPTSGEGELFTAAYVGRDIRLLADDDLIRVGSHHERGAVTTDEFAGVFLSGCGRRQIRTIPRKPVAARNSMALRRGRMRSGSVIS